jgi:hypothetical protein
MLNEQAPTPRVVAEQSDGSGGAQLSPLYDQVPLLQLAVMPPV